MRILRVHQAVYPDLAIQVASLKNRTEAIIKITNIAACSKCKLSSVSGQTLEAQPNNSQSAAASIEWKNGVHT